ncbi:MAG: hypothetical protein IPI60_19580 [Saprospiraceae bacterium]|nr:hypothetical protein [Saprospiraceae bacterium]
MILKINYYFQLIVLIIYVISNVVAFNGIVLMQSLLYLGILHLVSFVLLMIHPLSRSGTLFSNWMLYLGGVILVFLMIMAANSQGVMVLIVPICLILALFFVYNSYQLWKTREYDNA